MQYTFSPRQLDYYIYAFGILFEVGTMKLCFDVVLVLNIKVKCNNILIS